ADEARARPIPHRSPPTPRRASTRPPSACRARPRDSRRSHPSSTRVRNSVRVSGAPRIYTSRMSRHIIIGDIHGCFTELLELLERVHLTDDDIVVSVGDLVDRGPDSPRVLAYFRERCARGK